MKLRRKYEIAEFELDRKAWIMMECLYIYDTVEEITVARIRSACRKFRELTPILTFRFYFAGH